jgi:UDP-GlcNAc:undecaprenyl-phosphate/decaprenyl-phosphate GlcNAc-1-phosphate transferase
MDQGTFSMLTSFAVAFVLAIGFTLIIRTIADRWDIVDTPDGLRKFHGKRVPLWGGVAVYLAMSLGLFTAQWCTHFADVRLLDLARALVPAAGLVCLFGALDDCWDLPARLKLGLQVLSVLPIVASGYAMDRIVAFGYPIELGWLGVPLTVLWLVGCINALNLIDGMDGLASIVGLSTTLMMAIIAVSMNNGYVAVIAIALAGAVAGFLIFNLPPATIFLGDSGSTLIGLVVGILGIQGSLKSSATLAITAPAVIMSLPLFDVALAVVRRRLTGRRFDAADHQHIHHRLLDRGLTKWQVLCIIGALCLTTGAAATAATVFRVDALAWITVTVILLLMIRLRLFGNYELGLLRGAARRSLLRLTAAILGTTPPRSAKKALHRWHVEEDDPSQDPQEAEVTTADGKPQRKAA